MYDLTNLFDFIRELLLVVQNVLLLNAEVFARAFAYEGSLHSLVFWIVFIAGISMMIGQSAVLFANRVSKVRFWVSIFLGGLKFAIDVLIVGIIFWLLANLLSEESWPFAETVRAISIAYAPYWLAFLILIPYFGLLIEKGLNIYFFLALVVASQAIFQVHFLWGVVGAGLALVIDRGVVVLMSKALTPVADKIVMLVTGVQERKSVRELYAEFANKSITD